MAKEFNKKFMHPTRRKLVDMVMHGAEYEKESFISFSGADKEIIKRKVGEKWTDDDGKSWEQLEAGKVQTSELGDIMAETRAYLDKLNSCKADDCNTIKIGRIDKKLISKTGYCSTCLAKSNSLINILQLSLTGNPTTSSILSIVIFFILPTNFPIFKICR